MGINKLCISGPFAGIMRRYSLFQILGMPDVVESIAASEQINIPVVIHANISPRQARPAMSE